MGQRVRIFAARKWQLSLTLGGGPPAVGRAASIIGQRTATLTAPAARIIGPVPDPADLAQAGSAVRSKPD